MPKVSYPEMAASFWCAWRAISQPLVLVLCISARSEGQLTETSPIEMTNSRYRATCVLNSWTSWKRREFLSWNTYQKISYFGVHKQGLSLTPGCPLSSISSFYKLFKRLRHKDGKIFVQGKCLFFIGKFGHAWKLCFQTYSPPPVQTQFVKNKNIFGALSLPLPGH